jgi:hypothetical protein
MSEVAEKNVLKMNGKDRPKSWKGLVAGIAGGLAGTIAMTQFQCGWKKLSEVLGANSKETSGESDSQRKSDGEEATMKTAGRLPIGPIRSLTKEGGTLGHDAFGTALGGLYGVTREFPDMLDGLPAGVAGMGYGSPVFVGADEFAVTALGLSRSSHDTPLSSPA